jgi:hypothetical protein
MDNFWIINFNEQLEFQVYKCEDCSHNNIGDEMVDKNVIISVELGFKKSWKELYD